MCVSASFRGRDILHVSANLEKSILEAPQAMGIGGDNTGNIPIMFSDSATPTAPPRTDPAVSRSPPAPSERPAADHPG